MNNAKPPCCPHCGAHQLVAHRNRRRIFINPAGQRIPLLTVNFSLNHPVIEESTTTYTCTCSWTGNETELDSSG